MKTSLRVSAVLLAIFWTVVGVLRFGASVYFRWVDYRARRREAHERTE